LLRRRVQIANYVSAPVANLHAGRAAIASHETEPRWIKEHTRPRRQRNMSPARRRECRPEPVEEPPAAGRNPGCDADSNGHKNQKRKKATSPMNAHRNLATPRSLHPQKTVATTHRSSSSPPRQTATRDIRNGWAVSPFHQRTTPSRGLGSGRSRRGNESHRGNRSQAGLIRVDLNLTRELPSAREREARPNLT
jgi:hypothetical protein